MRIVLAIAAIAFAAPVMALESPPPCDPVDQTQGQGMQSERPVNTIDPVTGMPVDRNLPPITAWDMSGENPERVLIGVSSQESAERIRSSPQRYLGAARENRVALPHEADQASIEALPEERFDQTEGQQQQRSSFLLDRPRTIGKPAHRELEEVNPDRASARNFNRTTEHGMQTASEASEKRYQEQQGESY